MAKGYPHKQEFNIKGKPGKKKRAWWQLGNNNNKKETKHAS